MLIIITYPSAGGLPLGRLTWTGLASALLLAARLRRLVPILEREGGDNARVAAFLAGGCPPSLSLFFGGRPRRGGSVLLLLVVFAFVTGTTLGDFFIKSVILPRVGFGLLESVGFTFFTTPAVVGRSFTPAAAGFIGLDTLNQLDSFK